MFKGQSPVFPDDFKFRRCRYIKNRGQFSHNISAMWRENVTLGAQALG